jgi:anthranilate synthase component 2
VHIIRELGYDPDVFRNDQIALENVKCYDRILLSPGPGIPDEAGIMKSVIQTYGPTHSILGVCLGLQGIAEVYGSKLYNLKEVLHGVTSQISVVDDREYLFRGLPASFRITHYHSWAVDRTLENEALRITAFNSNGIIMAMAHRQFDVRGVQFHPESVMTEFGKELIENWLTGSKA